MKNKRLYILYSILLIVSLSCNFVTGKGTSSGNKSSTSVELGEAYTSSEGGYSFRSIPGYSLEEQWGITYMVAPDGDDTNGPLISLIGGLNNETKTSQDVYFSFLDSLDASFSVLEESQTTLAGAEAYDSHLEGVVEDVNIHVRILISAVTPTQQFTLAAIAPVDRWDEVAPYFDAVLETVEIFEPQVDEEDSGPTEPLPTEPPVVEEPDEPEEPAEGIPDDVPSPDTLATGKFIFSVTGQDEDATIEDGFIQDQSTTSDFVIGLMQAGDFARYFLSIMLKLDTAAGTFPMRAYDHSSAAKAPTAAIFVGAWYYYATKGTYEITEITHDFVSGRFFFEAVREDGNGVITVSGAFNQIPLVWK